MLDLAQCIVSRLFGRKECARRFDDRGANAQFSDEEILLAMQESNKDYEIPDFETVYATCLSRPYGNIPYDELYETLRIEPAHMRAKRVYLYFEFVVEFMRRHMLQLSQWSEWDANPVQVANIYAKCNSTNRKRTLFQPFYRRLHETVLRTKGDEKVSREPSERQFVTYYDGTIKTQTARTNNEQATRKK